MLSFLLLSFSSITSLIISMNMRRLNCKTLKQSNTVQFELISKSPPMEVLADPNLHDDTMRELYEASLNGRVSTLNTLMQKDPLILSRVSLYPFTETPLHIASLLGHLDFCKALLDIKPDLGSEMNSDGRCPLHLASAKGHTEVVKALLLTNPDTCMVRDKDDTLPLHFAAMRGRLGAIEELISVRPESIRERIETDDSTVLHLCIQYNHLDALKLVVDLVRGDDQFLCAQDKEGNTVLHLAVRRRQIKTIKYLISLSEMSPAINALNKAGLTALDVLGLYQRGFNSHAIEQILTEAGVQRSANMVTVQQGAPSLTLNTEQQTDQSQQQLTPSQSLTTEQHPVPLVSIPPATQQGEPSTTIETTQPPTPPSSSIDNNAQQQQPSSSSTDLSEHPPPSGSIDTITQPPPPSSSSTDLSEHPPPSGSMDTITQPPPPSSSSIDNHAQQQPPSSPSTDLSEHPPPSGSIDIITQSPPPSPPPSSSSTGPSQPPPTQEGIAVHTQQIINDPPAESSPSSRFERFCKKYLISQKNWMDDKQLMVAATVIATMTFQTVISPPGGAWGQDYYSTDGSYTCPSYGFCEAGTAIVGYAWSPDFMKFIFFNTTSFFSSLCVLLVIISGLPLDNKVVLWILSFLMVSAVTCMLLTYMWALGLTSPNHIYYKIRSLGFILICTWAFLLLLVCLIQVIRFIFWRRSRHRSLETAHSDVGT